MEEIMLAICETPRLVYANGSNEEVLITRGECLLLWWNNLGGGGYDFYSLSHNYFGWLKVFNPRDFRVFKLKGE